MSLKEQTYLKWLHSNVALPIALLVIIFLISLGVTNSTVEAALANFGSGDAALLGAFLLVGVVGDVDQHFAGTPDREDVLVSMRENCFTLSVIYFVVFAIMKWLNLSSEAAKAMSSTMPLLCSISLSLLLLAVLLAIWTKRRLIQTP